MSDVLLYLTLASSILVILFIVALLRRSSSSSVQKEEEEPRRPRNEPTVQVRRVGGRVVRSRLHRTRGEAATFEEERRNYEDDDSDLPRLEDDEGDEDESLIKSKFPDEKIGAKKRKKLEMKAEKKANQEQEMQMREEQKKRQELLDEQRKTEEEAARIEEAKQEELERLQKEEKERQEHEAYLKLKATFAIESEGFDHEGGEDDGQDLLKEFVKYIKNEKVVILEDLAARFKLKTQDAIDRVNSLMQSEDLMGVIDDRGKFIYISMEELQSVAKFIRQRGRVTISELAESSNMLINMNPNKDVDVAC